MIFERMTASKPLFVAATVACLVSLPAMAEVAGVLDCDVTPAQGFLIASKRNVVCTYRLTNGKSDAYAGTMIDAGLVLGELKSGKIVYKVFGLLPPAITDLKGSFIGGGIGGSVGLDKGLRADNLIGGPANAILLQPASETSTQASGVNVSAGLRTLSLTHSVLR